MKLNRLIVPAVLLLVGMPALAQKSVPLPYTVPDNMGNQWRVYQYGYLQQSGNQPLYSQAAMLMLNGNQPQSRDRTGKLDEKTGELILENMISQNFSVTRRVYFDKDNNIVRYVDIIKNTSNQEQQLNAMIQTSLNYGVNTSQLVPDPKKKDQMFAWVAQTSGNGAVMEMFSGKNAKTPMVITYQPGNSVVNANFNTSLGAGKEIALMHLHGCMPTQEGAAQYFLKLKESDLFKKIPVNIRKLIVNFTGGASYIGDIEILRGDILDVVELRGGDQLKGTLKEESYQLETFYGPVTLSVDRVIALMNVGAFRPRQLVVTTDGQIFGGTLKQETLSLQLSSGQVTKIPLSQVGRMGYRKRPGEPEEWVFEKPIVLMRSGERVGVKMPTAGFDVATRYGPLSLKAEQVGAIVLQSDETTMHQILLTDGSKFSGLLSADTVTMLLDAAGPDQQVKFPASTIARVQLTPKIAEIDDTTPTITLANDDVLVGAITGTLKVDTAFDTLTINASEIREMRRPQPSGLDVQVVLFDGSSVSGQLQEMELQASLIGGVKTKVPLALLVEYIQPQPTPSKDMEDKITAMIKELSAEDWKARDRAQQGLIQVGPVAIGALKRLRDGQPAETQQRIDTILKELEKQKEKPAKPTSAAPGTTPPAGRRAAFIEPIEEAPVPVLPQVIDG